MKKVLFLMMLMCFLLPINVKAEESVTIYMFKGKTCIHCEQALEYISEHMDEIPKNVKIMTYEVTDSNDNATLMNTMADKLGVDKSDNFGTPFFVVGDKYNVGYRPGDFEELFEIAKNYLENGEYIDKVQEEIKEENLEVKAVSLEDLLGGPSPVVTIIVYSIFGVVVLGFIALMVFSRK